MKKQNGALCASLSLRPSEVQAPSWYTLLYVQVLIAIAIGIALGHFYPDAGKAMKPLGDGVATIVISRWEGELDRDKLNAAMAHPVELGEALEAEPRGAAQ